MLFLFFLFCHFGNHLRARCCARVAQSQLHIVSEKRSFWRFSFPQPSDGCESRPHLWQFFDRTIGADLSANYIPLPGCCDKSWSMCWAPTRGSKFPSFWFLSFFFSGLKFAHGWKFDRLHHVPGWASTAAKPKFAYLFPAHGHVAPWRGCVLEPPPNTKAVPNKIGLKKSPS